MRYTSQPIHSILCIVAFDLGESHYKLLLYNTRLHGKPVAWITTTGTDDLLQRIEKRPDFSIPDEDFDAFADWYLAVAEKRELLGSTNHLLYICRKC